MNALATFPVLLNFGLIAPLLLRLAVGILRLFAGVDRYKKEYRWFSVPSVISSIFIIIGLYTQIATIVAIVCVAFDFVIEKKTSSLSREKNALTVLMTVILISLLFTGPGLFAFDLPL